jgi:hypothetical protein
MTSESLTVGVADLLLLRKRALHHKVGQLPDLG